ncbi:rod-binding protein [bacterium]|nr:rod-binding protein [bacterium]
MPGFGLSPSTLGGMARFEPGDSDAARAGRLLSGAERARASDTEAWQVAEAFEELFLNSMLKQMRQSIPTSEDSLDGSNASRIYQSMFDEEIARVSADRRQFGLSRLVHDFLMKGPGAISENRQTSDETSNSAVSREKIQKLWAIGSQSADSRKVDVSL